MKIQQHHSVTIEEASLSLVKKRVYVDEVRMCEGRRFQADDAATEKELFESWLLNSGTIKSPRDVDRSRVSEHGTEFGYVLYTLCPKKRPPFIFPITLSKINF